MYSNWDASCLVYTIHVWYDEIKFVPTLAFFFSKPYTYIWSLNISVCTFVALRMKMVYFIRLIEASWVKLCSCSLIYFEFESSSKYF